jgi:hypothetical protein
MAAYLFRASALSLLLATPLLAQQLATRALTKPDAEFQESFDAVSALRELPDGRVLVTDLGPKTVILADFTSGRQRTVGRNGQGPGEYQFPGELIALSGDSTLVVDQVSRRFLRIGPDGAIGKTLPFPEGLSGMPEARGADRQGRIYFQASPFGGGMMDDGGPPAIPDSVALIRWDRAANRLDTLARVKIASIKMQISGTSNARAVMMRPQPYAAADEWAVAPDGRVAVARVGDYHIDWIGTPVVHGAPVRFDPLTVTDADKQAYMNAMKNSRNRIVVNQGGPGRGSQEIKPPEPSAAEFEWPAVKPPFRAGRGQRASFVTPEGELWLARSTPAQDSTPVFDVFNGQGALSGRVTLPLGRRMVGIGRSAVYAVRIDEDGLQWLERYRR